MDEISQFGCGEISKLQGRPLSLSGLLCCMLTAKQGLTSGKMAETTINMVDALRGQQDQLKRLIAQTMLIRSAPKATLTEMESQVNELQRLLAQLETDIRDQLKRAK
jgi:hypothetical protein